MYTHYPLPKKLRWLVFFLANDWCSCCAVLMRDFLKEALHKYNETAGRIFSPPA